MTPISADEWVIENGWDVIGGYEDVLIVGYREVLIEFIALALEYW